MRSNNILLFILIFYFCIGAASAQEATYAEKLGFPKGAKVLIMHVDDVGMSWDSNQGAIEAMEKGVATSVSVMMPCPWVPGFLHYMKTHPQTDAGLHLTLTSEWKDYRWGPLVGKPAAPGLVDSEGALWRSVSDVVSHASADEVEAEIRAQLQRAREAGFEPTHLDSHMGTLFATPQFMERYIKVGVEHKIPVMFPGGHSTMIAKERNGDAAFLAQLKQTGQMLWNAGLPVLDDLHNVSYGFDYPKDKNFSDAHLQKFATSKYIETIGELKPGLTMVIMHCTAPSEVFSYISDSGRIRKGDMLAMMDPELKKYIEKEKIILTTWREVKERRGKVK
jgi:chitin disaccharide deacetylase